MKDTAVDRELVQRRPVSVASEGWIRQILSMAAVVLGLAGVGGPALAGGELRIYNWGNYTSPQLIEKFERAHGVKVTLDGYDSNETMLDHGKEWRRRIRHRRTR